MGLPERTRIYQNHTIDSSRWDGFVHRADDIVVATSYKSGTTWAQAIIANPLYPGGAFPKPVWQLSPWLGMRPLPLDRILGGLEWEQDGHPYWSHLRTVQSWFEWRHLPNILLLHYADMKADTLAAIARIAAYLGLDRTDEQLADVLKRTGCVRRASST